MDESENAEKRDPQWWVHLLSPRERMEVWFALNYVSQYNHGTSGHLGLTTLAKTATLLTRTIEMLEFYGHEIGAGELGSAFNQMSIAPKTTSE